MGSDLGDQRQGRHARLRVDLQHIEEPRGLPGIVEAKICPRHAAAAKGGMGLVADPCFVRIIRHPRGIPQYDLGHVERLAALEARLGDFPGLWLAGNSYRGISINACVEEAPRIAESVLDFIDRRDEATATRST